MGKWKDELHFPFAQRVERKVFRQANALGWLAVSGCECARYVAIFNVA